MKLKKFLTLTLSMVMLFSLLPSSKIQAADRYAFAYYVTSTTAKGEDCGTSVGNLYAYVRFYDEKGKTDGSQLWLQFDNTGDNKEAHGRTPTTAIPPWRISSVKIGNYSSNAYKSHKISLYVYVYVNGKESKKYPIGSPYYPKGNDGKGKSGVWIDSTNEHRNDIVMKIGSGNGPQTRNPSEITGWNAFGGTTYIDPGYTGNDTINVSLPGTLKDDRYNSSFGGSYNMFSIVDAPKLSLKIAGKAVDGSSVNESALKKEVDFARTTSGDFETGFKMNKKKLASYMNKKGINKIEITSTLKFSWWSFSDAKFTGDAGKKHGLVAGDTFEKTYTIYRSAFEVKGLFMKAVKDGNAQEPFSRNANNNYYNAEHEQIEVGVDVYYYNNDNGDADQSKDRKNTWNHFGNGFFDNVTVKFKSKPKLQIGADKENYVLANSNTATIKSWSDFYLYFDLPKGTIDSKDVGLTLILDEANFTVNGNTYYLTKTQVDYTTQASDKKGDAEYFESSYKADNIAPTADFTFDESEPTVNGWRKRAVLDYTVSEDLYTGNEASDIATLNYRLRSKDNPDVYYSITKKDGTERITVGEHVATASSGSTIIVANADGEKEIEGVLELVDTTDIAGNVATAVIDDVKLDNLAPRVSVIKTEEEKAADGSKSTKYSFTVEDASESAKIYYVFVKDTDQMPEFKADNVEDGSGEIENLFGKWAYVEQIPDGNTEIADGVNGTALLKVNNGAFFNGRLYWFAEDGLGNKTDIKPVDVNIYNENTEYDLTVHGNTGYPLKDYEIKITSSGNTVYWRWQHPDGGGAIADFKEYASASEVGKGTQKDSNGNDVILDGLCTLEFKIKTPAGTENIYTKEIVFDNSAPEVGFTNANSGTYRNAQTITAKADDPSGIKHATAILINADNSAIEGKEEFELSLTDGLLNDKITITDVPAGAYKLKVTAVDNNGYETTGISNPFYIRNAAPEMSLSVKSDKSFEEAPLFNENAYQVNVNVKEAFKEASGTQALYYRAADSAQEYGAWTKAGDMQATENGFELDFTVDTPVKLVEGTNNIYMQTIIAPEGVDPANLTGQNIIATKSITIYCDVSVPSYILSVDDVHTKDAIIGKLVLSDNLDGELSVDKNGISDSVLQIEKTENPDAYNITVLENLDNVIYAVDAAGNRTEIPVKISGIDKQAPAFSHNGALTDTSGERTFATTEITVSDASKGSVRFAVIPENDKNKAKNTDGTIKETYFTDISLEEGDTSTESAVTLTEEEITAFTSEIIREADASENEVNLTYKLTLKGISGKYCIGVRAEDSVGNSGDIIFDDLLLEPKDAKAEMVEYSVSPETAYGRAVVKVNFNVPVAVLPQNMITATPAEEMTVEETNLDNTRKYAGVYSEDYTFGIAKTGKYKLYITDELGRSQCIELNITDSDVTFSDDVHVNAYTAILGVENVYNRETHSYEGYVIHSEQKIADGEWMDTYVRQEYPINYEPVIVVEAPAGYKLVPSEKYSEDPYTFIDGVRFFDDLCDDLYATDYGYERLVYQISRISYEVYPNPDDPQEFYYVYPEISERSAELYLVTEATYADESLWIPVTATTGNVDNSPPQGTATITPVTKRDENWNPTVFTPGNVTVEATFADPQTGVDRLEFWVQTGHYIDEYGESSFENGYELVVPFIGENGNPIDYSTTPYTYRDENGAFEITVYSDTDLKSTKSMTIVAYENVRISTIILNTIGADGVLNISSEGELMIDYINKADIADSDFTLSYVYKNENGEWQPVEDGVYYKDAKAVITVTDSGLARGVYVSNNGGNSEKLLNSFDREFAFVLSDKYGYQKEVLAELSNFDTTPGTIDVNLEVTGKTNQPVPVTIAVSDSESGIGSVTLTRGSEHIALTDNGNGTYTGEVSNIGNHVVTFTDKAGNTAQKVFMVADIDATLPEIAKVEYNETERTSKTVSATIRYTKPNVTLTRVEPATADLASDDYVVDYSNSILRFHESGSLNVWFTDDYGNENADLVTVGNIYKTPPALEAVATVAENKMSVDVRFVKALDDAGAEIDPERELSEIMISHNGVTKRAVDWTGKTITQIDGVLQEVEVLNEAVFTFTENGKYTFKVYDDEGISSYLTIEITDIDKTAPKITQIRWSYDYDVLENGQWERKRVEGSRDVENESGYRIATDVNPITNQNVDVTVVTDSETTIMGDQSGEKSNEHTLTYQENGMYIFNVEKANGLSDSYGFDVAVIDKIPPVIELTAPELIFYENPDSNPIPYSKDLIAKAGEAFRAYDVFGGEIDLSDRVTIDYGTFNPDDITQNTFDRNVPYTITYTVSDDAHNIATAKMTIRLVGYFDTVALINGSLPDYAGRKEVNGNEITISLKNFSGVSYAKVEKGVKTMGQMKKTGTVLSEIEPGCGEYSFKPDGSGWYTILVQTDKRDYFNLQVYIWN